ncbi:MAG: T9SS type A sorting domain-containing protein [Algibacter sp.]|uniref:T9SS type A sorting domain-containing protein n=1 Tax=Algibacter sp. TaxID=1872428 RepID=UPI00329A1184
MKKITLLLFLLSTITFSAQTVNVKIIVDASAPGLYPDANYTNLCLNGTFAPGEEWWGWGIALVDDGTGDDATAGDGIWTGSRDIAQNSSYEFVLAGTGATDGWSGWGVQTGPTEPSCGGVAGSNYSFSTVTSDLELSISVLSTADGNGDWGGCLTESTLSNSEFKISSFKTYPNPTLDSWNIVAQNQEIISVSVFDFLGKNVLSLNPKTNKVEIDASILPSGIYFAKINSTSGIQSIKLLKK